MRKIVVAEFISLDGVVEAPETWHFPYLSEEMFAAMGVLAAGSDTMLLGRVTFQNFAAAFANAPAGDPVGEMMNRPLKAVVSNTLTEPGWANSTVLSGDMAEQVGKLKELDGGTILTTGSTKLVRAMLRAGLVDELDLMVHPVVVGAGERLFEADGPRVPLALTECVTFGTGVVHQTYRKV